MPITITRGGDIYTTEDPRVVGHNYPPGTKIHFVSAGVITDLWKTGPGLLEWSTAAGGGAGPPGPPGPAPSGTGFVKVLAGVLEEPAAAIAQAVVTNLTTDLAGKQPLDATLTALAALATTGYIECTAPDVFVPRTATQVTAALDVYTAVLKGLVPASGGGTSNFLRADGSWVPPLGGSDPWTYVKLLADFSSNATADTAVPLFFFTPLASLDYVVEGQLWLRTAAAATGARPGILWPTAGIVDGVSRLSAASSATTEALQIRGPKTTANALSLGLPTTGDSYAAVLDASFRTNGSVNGSPFQITIATETAGTNVTVRAGSWFRYRTI